MPDSMKKETDQLITYAPQSEFKSFQQWLWDTIFFYIFSGIYFDIMNSLNFFQSQGPRIHLSTNN